MQCFMTLNFRDIIAIQQPVHLLAIDRDDGLGLFGPFEFFFGEGFVVEYEAVFFPKKAFNFVALSVDENVEFSIKGIVAQLQLNNGGQTSITFSKIHRVTIEVDSGQCIGGT